MGASTPESLFKIQDLSNYTLTRKIAEGGMGSVYEGALHGPEGFRKVVAIKTILEKYSADPDFIQMFIGEAKLVADLVHQNIVQIYQLGRFGNLYYMAMEYINGVNLQQFMFRHVETSREVPLEIGVFIVSRVCRGLEYAHKKRDANGNLLGVVHRDISPKNLMISSEGEVKITDFGIAKARNLMLDREGEVLLGKLAYMSPEQFQYLPTDRRSDIYSLAMVLFELLTGANPSRFRKQGVMPGQRVKMNVPPPRSINPKIPEQLENIMVKGLEQDLSKRYQRAGEMAYDLEYFMYHKGYGPTIKTLEEYMATLFPNLYGLEPDELRQPDSTMPFPADEEGKTF
ncbi:MAG TPA: serine/threonine-protein kinase [Acidobacteriota bacterium]|nr:serine/threonine-protein kinase [Acidobacteriota bacterium]